MRSGRFRRATVASASVLLAVAGCAGADRPADQARAGVSSGPAASAAGTTPTAVASSALEAVAPGAVAASPTEPAHASTVVPAGGVLPRSVRYGMLSWTATDAAITSQDPGRYVAGVAGPPTTRTSLVLDLDVRNDDVHVSFLNTTARLVVEMPDGSVVPGKDLARAPVPPMSSVDGRYAFEVPPGTDFDGLVLRFEDPGREPSLDLPLDGPAPDVEADEVLDVDRRLDLDLPGVDMRWTIDRLVVGRDWPLPIGFKGGSLVPGARAETGQRFVGVVARVDVGRCDCRGGVLDQSWSVRLLVDGVPYTAAATATTKLIMTAQTFADVMLVFAVPADATGAVLQVGPLEHPEQQASATLDLD